jgi:hypothetical protein
MGRIHRYGQRKDCLIFNFVATNTIEGRVLQRLLEKPQEIRDALDDDSVCHLVIEAKCLGAGVEGALEQAKGYVEALGIPRDVIVTDGIRYRMYAGGRGLRQPCPTKEASCRPVRADAET